VVFCKTGGDVDHSEMFTRVPDTFGLFRHGFAHLLQRSGSHKTSKNIGVRGGNVLVLASKLPHRSRTFISTLRHDSLDPLFGNLGRLFEVVRRNQVCRHGKNESRTKSSVLYD